MPINKKIKIEVVYAARDVQRIFTVYAEEGSTIEQIIDRSGVLDAFPEIDLKKQKIGIFSKIKQLSDLVWDGDRIEIYRALLIDPKEARRRRAL